MPLARPLSLTAAWLTAALLSGCPGPNAEVRVTLCQDMTALALGTVPAWRGTDIQLHGYQGAVVEVRFVTDQGEGRAICHYRHLQGDDTALTLANPIEAYATAPSSLIVNERELRSTELTRFMEQALQQQGRAFIDRVIKRVGG